MELLQKEARTALMFVTIAFATIYIAIAAGFFDIVTIPFKFNEPYLTFLAQGKMSEPLARSFIINTFTIFIVTSLYLIWWFIISVSMKITAMLAKTIPLMATLAPFFAVWAFGNCWYNIPEYYAEWKKIVLLITGIQGIMVTYGFLIFVLCYKYAWEQRKEKYDTFEEKERHSLLSKEAKMYSWFFFKQALITSLLIAASFFSPLLS